MEDSTGQETFELTLDTCDLEPIHIPGTIQGFGGLIAGPADMSVIEYASANIGDFTGTAAEDLLGCPFSEIFDNRIVHDLRNLASMSTARSQRERVGQYALPNGTCEVYLHVNVSDQVVVELEHVAEAADASKKSPVEQMRKYLSAAGARETIDGMLNVCVTGLSALTGYDRVMAYRYEANGDGEVVAECRHAETDSFLGLRYPAWDVPTQARALQVKNPVRLLSNVDQEPIPVLAHDAKLPPLDMSLSHLRGVSPIHVQYLKNMRVKATLTIGLVVEGRLWGMFACHHSAPKVITSDVRIAVELFGQMISLLVKQKLDLEATSYRHRAAEARERVLAETDAKTDLLHSFPRLAPILAKVVNCDGLAISYDGKTLVHGSTASSAAIEAIASHAPDDENLLLPISNLGQSGLTGELDLKHTAGALLIRATAAYPLQLIYFRDEKLRTLNWAGRPEKQMETGPFGPRISPRGSFDKYVENQKGFAEAWSEADLAAAREIQVLLTQITAKGERVQLMRHQDLVTHQRQQDLMIAELNHRVKNILALIRSLSRQAKASSASLESYAIALEQRIAALAAAHDLAVSNTMAGVSLRGILTTELSPYLGEDTSQVLMNGPLVGLRADVAPMVALVLHEIVSNAAKYGALSTDDGLVRIKWKLQDETLRFEWQEFNGPEVAAPERHGFGRSLIEKAIPYELDGEVDLAFDKNGVRFSFSLPAENLVEIEAETTSKLVGSIAKIERAASGKVAMLVEDNVVLAMDVMESLSRLGTERVDMASSLEAGLKLAEQGTFDFAVLDMNLRGEVSFDIAERLKARGIPFAFVTGYGSSIDLPSELGDIPILTKPIDEGTLSRCVQDLLK